jgi:hypothetical protein
MPVPKQDKMPGVMAKEKFGGYYKVTYYLNFARSDRKKL